MDLDAIRKRVKSARRGFGSSDDWRLNTIDALLSHVTDQAAQTAKLEGELAEIRAVISDPAALHANILRGTVAKMGIREMLHCHGAEALAHWDSVATLTAERDAAREKATEYGQAILDIADKAQDEGDRAYFGSTNDLDRLRKLRDEYFEWRFLSKDELEKAEAILSQEQTNG
jgi:hypothetical protein